jgi:hypothetical protein
VPAGKRLVIQTISATGFTDPGITITDFRLSSHVGGATAEDNLLGTQTETNLISKWSVSVADARAVTIYADPGTKLEIFAQASGVSTSFNAAFASLYISGYLVPAN